MKSKLILFSILIFFASCSLSRRQSNNLNYSVDSQHLSVNEKFERVDTSTFLIRNSDTIVRGGDIIYRNEYRERNINTGYLKYRTLVYSVPGSNYYEQEESFGNSIFSIHKEFYLSGNIRTKGIKCLLGFNIGLWYEYDDKGQLIKIVDYDKGYLFNTSSILNYCIKNNIPLTESLNIPRANINKRRTHDGKFIWDVIYNTGNMTIRQIVINAKNGRVLSKKVYGVIE